MAELVPHRMRWKGMSARNPSGRQRLGSGVGAFVPQQFGEHVRMRPFGTFTIRRWDRLKDLDAPYPAEERAVRVCRQA
jgi:hypothetical protein